jgi:hypothetical protein
LQKGAVQIVVEDVARLELAPGTYDWRDFEVEFDVGDAPDPTLTVVTLKLMLISAGGGEAYLDDLHIAVTPD